VHSFNEENIDYPRDDLSQEAKDTINAQKLKIMEQYNAGLSLAD